VNRGEVEVVVKPGLTGGSLRNHKIEQGQSVLFTDFNASKSPDG
jgi:hypothetical protein